MAVFRVNKNRNYTVMSNYHLKDKNLSLKAKGLLSFMLSLPDDWDYSINGLVALCKEEIKAIRSTIKELETNGYLVRERIQKEKGMFDYNYSVFEEPYSHYGYTDNGRTHNELQINTKELNNKYKDKIDKQINKFVNELLKKEFIDENDLELDRYNDLFNELDNKYPYQVLIKAFNYTLSRFKLNKGYDEQGNKIENKYAYLKSSILNNLKRLTEEDNDLDW